MFSPHNTGAITSSLTCFFLMNCAQLPMHNRICSKQVHKLSAQTAVPPKRHLENYLIHFICFVHRAVIDSSVMKLRVDSLNVLLKSITRNVMPRRARVQEYNYDQFELLRAAILNQAPHRDKGRLTWRYKTLCVCVTWRSSTLPKTSSSDCN